MPMDDTDKRQTSPSSAQSAMRSEYLIHAAEETTAQTLALQLVGWILSDVARVERMFSITGLDPDSLRASLSDPAALGAIMDFVINHEPDLLACADALGIRPAAIVTARERLAR